MIVPLHHVCCLEVKDAEMFMLHVMKHHIMFLSSVIHILGFWAFRCYLLFFPQSVYTELKGNVVGYIFLQIDNNNPYCRLRNSYRVGFRKNSLSLRCYTWDRRHSTSSWCAGTADLRCFSSVVKCCWLRVFWSKGGRAGWDFVIIFSLVEECFLSGRVFWWAFVSELF